MMLRAMHDDGSKRVMNQTMFDVPDHLVVHALLLTHELYV